MDLWHFTPVAIIYFLTAAISLILSYLAWQMRPVKGAGVFSVMMISVFIWVTATLLGIFSNSFPWKILMLKFEYLGMAGSAFSWLIFVSIYTHYDKWLKKWVYGLLAIIPVITLLKVFQAPEGTSIHESYYLITIKGISVFAPNFGGWFYLWTAFAYLLMLAGVVFLILRIIQTPPSLRKQLVLLIPAVFVVMLPNILYITKNNPLAPYDPTPLALVIVGILFLSTMYFYQFLNVVPVAHDQVFKNVKAGVIILNNKNLILEYNTMASKIFETETDLTGKNIFNVLPEIQGFLSSTDDASEVKAEINLGSGKNSYELKLDSLKDSSNNIHGKILMLWDITDQKMAMSELDAYARTVAHDLKTPLGHIMGFAQFIKDNEVNGKLKDDYLSNIISGGEKMKTIVDGLLMLAKIRNQQSIELSELDTESIIQSVLSRMSESILAHNVSLYLPPKWERALGNGIWVEEVWVNLISNAIKYGGNPPVIEIGSVKVGNTIKFWVKDNGNGLSKVDQEQIFEEFSRLHPKKDTIKGHGIGLSIVQRIIKKMGGKVEMNSKVGTGSTFYFSLPAVEQKSPDVTLENV
jgi:signal transduction histidine kinase